MHERGAPVCQECPAVCVVIFTDVELAEQMMLNRVLHQL